MAATFKNCPSSTFSLERDNDTKQDKLFNTSKNCTRSVSPAGTHYPSAQEARKACALISILEVDTLLWQAQQQFGKSPWQFVMTLVSILEVVTLVSVRSEQLHHFLLFRGKITSISIGGGYEQG